MDRSIDAGKLDVRVTFQRRNDETDALGDYQLTSDEGWSDVCTVWASVETVRSREFYAAAQVQAEVTHKVTVRYRPEIRPDMRIKYGKRIFFPAQPPIEHSGREGLILILAREIVR